MATESNTPAALLARNTWTNEYSRTSNRTVAPDFIRLTKTGRVNVTDDPKKATVFTSEQDAKAAITARGAYMTRINKGRNPTGVINSWAVVAA